MTIVKTSAQLQHYPFHRFEEDARALFFYASKKLPETAYTQGIEALWKAMECYLAVTSQTLHLAVMKAPGSQQLFQGFVGALAGDELIGWSPVTRDSHTRTFILLVKVLAREGKTAANDFKDETKCVLVWKRLQREPTAVEYWSGWWINGANGVDTFMDMTAVWNHIDAEFCRVTFAALKAYWAGRDNSISNSRSLFNEFFTQLGSTPEYQSTNPFSSSRSLSDMIRRFCESYFNRVHARSLSMTTSRKRWNDWRTVVLEALIEPRIWETPRPSIPVASQCETPGSRTHLRITKDGIEIREKFLTEIPLNLSDNKAIEVLIESVKADKDSVVDWCRELANDLFNQCRTQITLAQEGCDILPSGRIVGNDRTVTPCDLAATFQKHGFAMFQSSANFRGVTNWTRSTTASLLGIPLSGDLEPFMYLLINEHPAITDAFLRNLRLFDKSGIEIGFLKGDTGYTLVGEKRRRGSALAEQRFPLNHASEKLVHEIVFITKPLRDWLRSQGNDDWRYLFLSCAYGLSKPSVVRNRVSGNPKAKPRLIDSLAKHTQRTGKDLELLYDQLTLTSFRASRALTEFFSNGDEHILSSVLGHSRHNPGLLSHYLPESIQTYFKSRSIRKMQNSLIAEAMKDSPYLFDATDFSSMEDLNSFLENNCFVRLDDNEDVASHELVTGQVYLDVGEPTLTILAAIRRASISEPDRINLQARRWVEYANLLFAEIERVQHDTRLQGRYKRANEKSELTSVLALICDAEARI